MFESNFIAIAAMNRHNYVDKKKQDMNHFEKNSFDALRERLNMNVHASEGSVALSMKIAYMKKTLSDKKAPQSSLLHR